MALPQWSAANQTYTGGGSGGNVIVVQSARVGTSVSLGGTVVPYREVTLSAQVPGRIDFLSGEEGDRFEEGALLVKVNDDELRANRAAAEAELQTDEDFQLTPLSEGGLSEEGDSSSQVIALDADIDDLGDDVGVLDDDVGFSEDVGHDVMIAEDFASAPGDEFEMGSYAGAGPAGVSAEVPYSVGQLIGLFSCVAMVSLAGVMMLDMIRNIWSWDEPYSLSSSLIDSLLGLFS